MFHMMFPNEMELAVLLNLQTCFKATEVHTMIIQIPKKRNVL